MKFQKGHKVNLGRKHSKETIKKLSDSHKGQVPWNKGKHFSQETKKKMSEAHKGTKNANWKGGQCQKPDGRVFLKTNEHPFAHRGYVSRSRLTMEKILGRYLKPCEVVHHKGIDYPFSSIENKQDDRPENLQLFPNQSAHAKFHYYEIDSKTRIGPSGRLYSLH